eukprot:1074081-Prorocentrum_minimum.AAC.1
MPHRPPRGPPAPAPAAMPPSSVRGASITVDASFLSKRCEYHRRCLPPQQDSALGRNVWWLCIPGGPAVQAGRAARIGHSSEGAR